MEADYHGQQNPASGRSGGVFRHEWLRRWRRFRRGNGRIRPGLRGKCDVGVTLTLRSGPRLLAWDELLILSELPGRREGDRYVVEGASPQLATAGC